MPSGFNGNGPAVVAIVRRPSVGGFLNNMISPLRSFEDQIPKVDASAEQGANPSANIHIALDHLVAALGAFHK